MQSFAEAMTSVNHIAEKSILLGNGFSQAWNNTVFNYQNLFAEANFGAHDTEIRAVFNRFDTYDFEKITKCLLDAANVLELYRDDVHLINSIRADAESLKDALLTAIANTHPERPNNIPSNDYRLVRAFLSRFSNIFTLNYDLLMYWARNQNDIAPLDYETDDGFRGRGAWQGYDTNQQVFFLHGGLHIFDTPSVVKKHRYINDMAIIDQVRGNLADNKFPLFVSEPTSEKKLTRILHNQYLNFCYQSLRQKQGVLFIYGHSCHENDKHIFDQIKRGGFTHVLISIFGDPDSPENQRTQANARTFLGANLNIGFYDAGTTTIWR